MTMNSTAVTPQVQCGLPFRACFVLNQCRIVTPIRNTRLAISQLYSVANTSG